jgi:hypothetical protein
LRLSKEIFIVNAVLRYFSLLGRHHWWMLFVLMMHHWWLVLFLILLLYWHLLF